MGRTAVHSQEQVFEAADRLAANGQEVSPNALRDLLGRGSYSTFVKHIDAWNQARQSAPAPVVLEMPDSVKAAFAQCWQAAASEAGKEIAAIREKSDVEIKATKRRLDEAITAIEQLEGEAEADTARLETAEANLAAERATSQQAATDAAAREASLSATADQMRRQIEAQQVELASVHAEAEAARAQHSSEIARITADFARHLAEQSTALKSSQGDVDRLREQLAVAATALEAATVRERQKIEETAAVKTDLLILNDVFERQKTQIAELTQSNDALDIELNAAHRAMQDQAERLGKATGALESLRAQVADQTALIKGFAAAAHPEKKTK